MKVCSLPYSQYPHDVMPHSLTVVNSLLSALVSSSFDYCNSLLTVHFESYLDEASKVQRNLGQSYPPKVQNMNICHRYAKNCTTAYRKANNFLGWATCIQNSRFKWTFIIFNLFWLQRLLFTQQGYLTFSISLFHEQGRLSLGAPFLLFVLCFGLFRQLLTVQSLFWPSDLNYDLIISLIHCLRRLIPCLLGLLSWLSAGLTMEFDFHNYFDWLRPSTDILSIMTVALMKFLDENRVAYLTSKDLHQKIHPPIFER